MADPPDSPLRVAIVGGGAAGTLVACELLLHDEPMVVDIFETRDEIGRGLAYSTDDDQHVVNVPTARMSAVAHDPDHLTRWLATNGLDARDEAFPRRSTYGRYIQELLAARSKAATRCRVTHVRALVTSIERAADMVEVRLDGRGERATYDHAVLALGNVDAAPALELPADARCFASPWAPGALARGELGRDASVLIIGTGLTAVDAALSLARELPAAKITMVSRNGQLPFAHLPGPLRAPWPSDTFPLDLADFDDLHRAWDDHLARGIAAGHDWRDVVDGLRPRTQQLWRALDTSGQSRFLRERRRDWEARRNRAAPDVGARLDELVAAGRLRVLAGSVDHVEATATGIRVGVAGEQVIVERLVSCTGPTADVTATTNPLLRDLLDTGLATPDTHRLAVRTSDDGELVRADGSVDDRLLTLGWMRRGELWETLAIPEIREQAQAIAARLTGRVSGAVAVEQPLR